MFTIFLLGIMELIISGLIEMISSDLNISYGLTGQLITVYAVSFAVFGPLLIQISEKFSQKKMILYSFLIFILGNVIFMLSQSFFTLAIGRVITAMGASVLIVKILDLTSLLSEAHLRGKMIALVYMGFSAANVFGIPISTLVGNIFGWREVFFIIIILTIIVSTILLRKLPETSHISNIDDENIILNKKNVVLYITITLLVLTANFNIIGYISPLLTENSFSLNQVSLALFVAGLGGMSGTYLGGILVDKFNIKHAIITMLILFTTMAISLPFTFNIPLLFFIAFYLFNVFQWSTSPMIQSGLVNSVKGSASKVFSWNMSSLNLGIGLGAVIGGIFIDKIVVSYLPFISAVFLVIGIVIATQLTYVESRK
ncbi:putative MFS family arabinose efflux permease [Nosocomiicoccus ampullae]|uniref:MFS family arabinose efflux permease n=2 Tax=Nosocomiicoccus ampullae TaxID=489910 RepID=A0A9Q2HF73_9STAP|nr:putative MFS family arabinose efflux permease [Nosocomiicoccus ampullae]